jgi:class 3 adenylate cyclase
MLGAMRHDFLTAQTADIFRGGTVTFLFTDIEASTRLLHELGPEAYADALDEHRRALREAFAAGAEVDTQGDAFFYAFADARQAVAAARAGQEALTAVNVRMGLHTGAPLLRGDHYVGEDVHLGARVASAGHGGQIVLTKATRDLLDGVAVRDLGEHQVKDFDETVWSATRRAQPPRMTPTSRGGSPT